MQINLKELSTQAIESTVGTKKMRLSEHTSSMVFQLFTKNVYSNPIGTVVREITSNCFDSHTEAKVNAPILIKKSLDKQTNTNYISFIDYGVGMSPDRIENIYGVYFESTKRVDNTQIGGFGIGGKTPLAYKRSTGQGEAEYDNSFYVITIFDNIKYYYCIYEGADSPIISLLHQEETSERNGTEVRIPVLEKDLNTFANEMVRQLYYFENIVFEGFEDSRYAKTITNDYQIVRAKTFLFRGDDYSSNVHICLGRVAYPIDYQILGLSSYDYNLPIAIKLEVGDIGVTVSRESLDYSETTIKMLKKKLIEVKAEIKEMIAKQYENIVTLEDYFKVKNNFGHLKFSNGKSISLSNMIKQSDIDFSNFTYADVKIPNDKQLFKLFFNVGTYGKKPARSRYYGYEFDGGYTELQKINLLYIDGDFNRKVVKQAYLKSEHGLYHIIRKRDMNDFQIKIEIAELFNVRVNDTYNADGTASIRNTFIEDNIIPMQDEYFAIVQRKTTNYDTLEVPEDFIVARKRRDILSDEVRNTTIPLKFISPYGGKDRVKLDDLFKFSMPIIYGNQEDNYKLVNRKNIFELLFDKKLIINGYGNVGKFYHDSSDRYSSKTTQTIKGGIMFIMLSQSNMKYMKYCKNAIHVDDFYWKILYRKVDMVQQYFQTYQLIELYNELPELYKDKDFKLLNKDWAKKINAVNKYIETMPRKGDSSIGANRTLIEKFFTIDDIPMSKEQKAIADTINELKALETKNHDVLDVLNRCYRLSCTSTIQIEVMKKIMEF